LNSKVTSRGVRATVAPVAGWVPTRIAWADALAGASATAPSAAAIASVKMRRW
jgi:hypothetical protein